MYITIRGNNLIYRRRIPTELKPYMQMTEFKKALVPDMKSAKIIANHYDNIFSKMQTNIKLGFTDISSLLSQLGIEETAIKRDSLYDAFLNSKKSISKTSHNEYKQQLQLFSMLLPEEIDNISYSHIDRITGIISALPKRNIQKYRKMSLKELLKAEVQESDRLSIKSQNEYLKTLRALLKFAKQRGYIQSNNDVNVHLFTQKVSSRAQRQTLDTDDIQLLLNHHNKKLNVLVKILYYSGMRLSEVYKCKVTDIEGIKCFDLTDRTIALKTQSSYRYIPVHPALYNVEALLEEAKQIKPNHATKLASKALLTTGKTLYSLRHTFATKLASNGVEIAIVSELLGHSHKGMTSSRYVKGFPTQLLSESINKLNILDTHYKIFN